MLTKFKQKIQSALAAEARAFRKMGFTPNKISALGVLLAFSSGIVYAVWGGNSLRLFAAAALLLLSGLCDALDGVVARLYHESTLAGGFLDSLSDRYADAAVYVGIVVGGLCDILFGLTSLVGSLLVSYSRARAEAAGVKIESVGIAERAERIIILAAASLMAIFADPRTIMNAAIIVIAVLSHLTVLQRGLYAHSKLKKKETG